MRTWLSLLLCCATLLAARAQNSVVLVPAPPLSVNPANPQSQGVYISPGLGDYHSYGIDLNGDGIVDFTLTTTDIYQGLDIIPSGQNAVLAHVVDPFGSSYAANLSPGTVVGPQPPAGAVWQPSIVLSTGSLYPVISFANANGVYGEFAGVSGFIGLQFMAGNQIHYGFLQIDCTGGSGYDCFYEGYGWNTTAGDALTVSPVPEPSTWALLALGAAAFWAGRFQKFQQ